MSDKDKGFASMDKDKVKEPDTKGGQASHKNDHDKDNKDNKDSNKSSSKSKGQSHTK